MNDLIYIHGLGSNQNSRKFLLMKEKFQALFNCKCIEWDLLTDIDLLIKKLYIKYKDHDNLVIVGDSTGGNFAYQLRELMKLTDVKTKLILLNPLLDFNSRIASFPFPREIEKYLQVINFVNCCFLLQSTNDEIIDHAKIKTGNRVVQIKIDDTHRIINFDKYLDDLKNYIEAEGNFLYFPTNTMK